MTVRLQNPHLAELDNDSLHHLGFCSKQSDLKTIFGQVKFVCMGGTQTRMRQCMEYLTEELGLEKPKDGFKDYTGNLGRYSLFVNGPIMTINHGIGFSSLSVVLNEVLKLLHYAQCTDVRIFRIGTCGGIGLKPGSVVVSKKCVDGLLRPSYDTITLGRSVSRPAILDAELCKKLVNCTRETDDFDIVSGTTISTADFYEGQGRLDGAFCDYTKEDKMKYLREINDKGVVNVEMEGVLLASMCHHAGVKAAVVCVTLLDRLHGDQVLGNVHDFEKRPILVVGRYIKQCLDI